MYPLAKCIMKLEKNLLSFILTFSVNLPVNSFPFPPHGSRPVLHANDPKNTIILRKTKNSDVETISSTSTSTYENSDSSSKGVVSLLTNFVNFLMGSSFEDEENTSILTIDEIPPSSPTQLLEKIKEDYVDRNYLRTGDICLPAFEKDCRFTDPTLSFTGRDKFVSNVQNLRPVLDALMKRTDSEKKNSCKSDLLDISLNEKEGYVQSRWNMVGKLSRLPWKPKIDVIGKTKFWYREVDFDNNIEGMDSKGVRVYFYDEAWEIPAGKALLQLITPDSSTEL